MRLASRCLTGLLAATALFTCAAHAAERYPAKPIRAIVGYPPGGGTDLVGRMVGQKVAENFRQTVVIDNRAGASGMIGAELAAKSPPDGYTILFTNADHTLNALVYAKPRYDAIRDFTPINLLATTPFALLAHPSFSANTLKELLAMPRSQTEKLAMGSSGLATGPHLSYELLRLTTGLTLNHVPYKGGGPSLADAVGGQIPLALNALSPAVPYIQAGRLKVLGITSAQRHPLLPGIPTFQESGVKDYVTVQWYGLLGPPGMPKDIVSLLNREINKVLAMPEIRERFVTLTLDATPGAPEEFRKLLDSEVGLWKGVLKQVRVQLD
jgi:tripartite-type tricarboxylate transporter receptor subunit TctC